MLKGLPVSRRFDDRIFALHEGAGSRPEPSSPASCEGTERFRLGIMGGTFDPIHLGHMICAREPREHYQLDAVLFIPTGRPSFKEGEEVTPAAHRLAMVTRAVEDDPFLDVSSIEVDRSGITYTVDTLRALREYYPPWVDFFFITGSDSLLTLPSWKDADELATLATFIGAIRPGYDPMLDERFARLAQGAQGVQGAQSTRGFDIRILEVDALDISSTQIRERVRRGESLEGLVDPRVIDYIIRNGLYR